MLDRVLGFDEQMIYSLLFQLVNTGVLALILSYLLYNPVRKFMRERREKIKAQIETAELNFSKAETLKAEYEEKLKRIDEERTEILEAARKRGLEKEQSIITEAKQEATTIRNRALADIELEKDKAHDEMKTQIIELSTLMASRFVSTSIDENTQNKLLDEVISDLGEVRWVN